MVIFLCPYAQMYASNERCLEDCFGITWKDKPPCLDFPKYLLEELGIRDQQQMNDCRRIWYKVKIGEECGVKTVALPQLTLIDSQISVVMPSGASYERHVTLFLEEIVLRDLVGPQQSL